MSFINFPSPTPIFPVLTPAPQGWSVHKEPNFQKTLTEVSVSGREYQVNRQVVPRFEFTLTFGGESWLRDQTQNINPYNPLAGFTELEQLAGLFLACLGSYGEFYYTDPDDNSRLAQGVGIGDGTNVTFLMYFSWGTGPFTPEATYPVMGISSLDTVYLNGVPQSPLTYSLDSSLTLLTFTSPPGSGVAITADFHFYFRCRFMNDMEGFSQWAKNLWESRELKFISVKNDGPAPPPYEHNLQPPCALVPVLARAVHFNGTNTALYRTSALAGIADSAQGTVSFWFKSNSTRTPYMLYWTVGLNGSSLPDAASHGSFIAPSQPANINHGWGAYLEVADSSNFYQFDEGPGTFPALEGSVGAGFNNQWHHVILSWDTSANNSGTNTYLTTLSADTTIGSNVINLHTPPTSFGGSGVAIGNGVTIGNVFYGRVIGLAGSGTSCTAITLNRNVTGVIPAGTTVSSFSEPSWITKAQYALDGVLSQTVFAEGFPNSPWTGFSADFAAIGLVINGVGFTGTAPQGLWTTDLTELWFDTVNFDLSVPTNVQKFRTTGGKPADLGTNGQTPTGSIPPIYNTIPPTGPASQFATNAGAGGAFSINGTLIRATTDPF